MIRALRTILSLEGLLMSWQAWSRTSSSRTPEPVPNDVRQTPQASLFGVRNELVAAAYFLAMGLLSLTGLIDRRPLRGIALLTSWVSLAVSGYLAYSLAFILRKNCKSCIRTQLLNLALTLAITARTGRSSGYRRRNRRG